MKHIKPVARMGLPLLLLAWLLYSIIAVPIVKEQNVERLNALREQSRIYEKAQEEYSRLLLEQAMLNAPARIEHLAMTQLQMHVPALNQRREWRP